MHDTGREEYSVYLLHHKDKLLTVLDFFSRNVGKQRFYVKDTMISLSRIVSLLTVDTKWAELVTVYSDFPVKGDKMLAK